MSLAAASSLSKYVHSPLVGLNIFPLRFSQFFKGVVQHFGKYAFLHPGGELDEED